MVLTTQALQAVQPNAITVQVEALWYTWSRDPALASLVEENNAKQYLCFDLATGRVDEHYPLAGYLHRHGVSSAELAWFRGQAVTFDFFGANFYPWAYTELIQQANGKPRRIRTRTHGSKIGDVIHHTYSRYHLPIIITETSAKGDIARRGQWMDQTLHTIRDLRVQGLPIVGYTWFPFMTMIDWAYRRGRRPLEYYLIHLGLCDSTFDADGILQRSQTSLVARYQQHMAQSVPPLYSAS
jgi:hypothetical protein